MTSSARFPVSLSQDGSTQRSHTSDKEPISIFNEGRIQAAESSFTTSAACNFSMSVNPDSNILTKMLTSTAFSEFISNYNLILTVLLGIVTLTILILLFLNITKLSASANNEMKRRMAISGILVCLVCLGIMGAIDTFYAIILSFVFKLGT